MVRYANLPRRFDLFAIAISALCVLGATTPRFVQAQQGNTETVAVIQSDQGELVIRFWPDVAPKTVENFQKLANEEYYDGTAFHRIINGFMIQGGDPLTRDDAQKAKWGTGGPGYQIDAEFNDRKHVRGVISMARSQDPNSAGSQFFICLADVPQLDNKYTAFGELVAGDDVLEKLAQSEVQHNQARTEKSVPVERVGIQSIRIEQRSIGDERP